MAAPELQFANFLLDVHPAQRQWVEDLHAFLLAQDCKAKLQMAKSGYVVSYVDGRGKRTLMNYIFRKSGLMVRLYGDHLNQYLDALAALPESMQKIMAKAPVCRRLVNPTDCNPRCQTGYDYTLGDAHYQKCRYSGLLFPVNEETEAALRTLVEREAALRTT